MLTSRSKCVAGVKSISKTFLRTAKFLLMPFGLTHTHSSIKVGTGLYQFTFTTGLGLRNAKHRVHTVEYISSTKNEAAQAAIEQLCLQIFKLNNAA